MNNYLSRKGDGFFGLDFFRDPFDDFFAPTTFSIKREMRTDVKETENGYSFSIDLAGFDKKDVNVDFSNGYLIVEAEKKDSENDKYLKRERVSSCKRSYYVGDKVKIEDIKAKLENGILEILVPKNSPEKLTGRKIEIE